ncbi:MAG: pentapeptide repeat-containing protein [Saprospiraceae bacterium]
MGIVDAFELKDDPSGLAYLLILKSMINSANNLAKENQHKFRIETKDLDVLHDDDDYVKFLNGMDDILENEELTINKNTLTNPRSLTQVLEPFQAYFIEWIQFFGIKKIEAEVLSHRLPTYFVFAFNDEWRQEAATYEILTRNLDTPATQAALEELEWMQYNSFLQQEVEKPVFDEHFSLRQIYIPLRAYFIREEKLKKEGFEEKKKVKIPINLEAELDSWLKTANSKEAIKIISGGPGSGKSTFAKIWSARQAEEGTIRIIFVPLHFFDLQGDLVNSVSKFIELNIDIHVSYNPLRRDEKILLIFDGLDELTQQGEYAAEVARKFVLAIHQHNAYCNRDNKIKTLFLLLGRELIVQSTSSNFRQERQVLHLLPYFIIDREDDFEGDEKILQEDQRDIWWKNYGQLTGQNFPNMPEEIKNPSLDEITAQPLLNYLVALSKKRGKIVFSAETNLNEIYNDLIEGVQQRQYEGGREYKAIEGLKKDDFKRVLEEIAIAAWHGGDLRTTTVGRIQKHIERSGLQALLERFKEGAKSGITRLLTAFYFREYGIENGEQTFEFTHKSFGEYLTAARLVKLVSKIHQQVKLRQSDYDVGWDEKKALLTWLEVTGESPIDNYLLIFIRNEVKKQPVERLKEWQLTLSNLISFVLKNGLPILKHDETIKENWRVTRNAEEALLVILNSCAIQTKEISKINFPLDTSLGEWISKIQPQRLDGSNVIAFSCLSYLDINHQIFHLKDLFSVNLQGAKLQNAKLQNANLQYADLQNANLQNANLQGTNLQNADLQGAKLQNAKLQNTNLQNTNLQYANLLSANLQDADLQDANLQYANLQDADLQDADLQDAKLQYANLQYANLQNAKLQYANLQDANLQNAKLQYAKLQNAKLQNAKLRGAIGLSIDQLSQVISLRNCTGLDSKIEKELKKQKPELFE